LGNLPLGKVETRLRKFPPLDWRADMRFALSRDALTVNSLRLVSGRSQLTARGRLENFRRPRLVAGYDLQIDLAEAGAVLGDPRIEAGVFEASGSGNWSANDFSSTGQVGVKDLGGRAGFETIRNASWSAQFTATPRRLTFSSLSAKLVGGSWTGGAEIENWLEFPSARSAGGGKKSEEQRGTLRLQAKDLSLAEAIAGWRRTGQSLDHMHLAALGAGSFDARWRGSIRNLEAELALELSAPVVPVASQLPLSGRLAASYSGRLGAWKVASLDASTPSSHVHLEGTVASNTQLSVAGNTNDPGEWQRMIAALGGPSHWPLEIRGSTEVNGTIGGNPSALAFTGTLAAENLDVILAASAGGGGRTVHCDALRTDLALSSAEFFLRNGNLRRNQTTVRFDGTGDFLATGLVPDSRFSLHLSVHQGELGEMLALAGSSAPASGKVDFSLHATGTPADPRGEAQVEVSDARIGGYDLDHLRSRVRFEAGQLFFEGLRVTRGPSEVTGSGNYLSRPRSFQLELEGKNFDLASVSFLERSRIQVKGNMDFTAQASGTLDAPAIRATLRFHHLAFGQDTAGDFIVQGVTEGGNLHVDGHSQSAERELSIVGDVHLRDDWPAELSLHCVDCDLDPLLRAYVGESITGRSALTGDFSLRGPLRNFRQLTVTGALSQISAEVESVKVRNDGPVRFEVSEQSLRLAPSHFLGPETDVLASGSLGLSGARQIDARAEGKMNLEILESFDPNFTSSGVVTINAALSGTLAKPLVHGRVQVEHGAIAYVDLPSGLTDIEGSVAFNQNRVEIENLSAHTGGGRVSFSGNATAYNRQLNFDLGVRGEDVRLRYLPGVSSTADADLRWLGSSSASTLSGDITVNKLAITPGFDFGAYLQRSAQASSLPQTNPVLNRIRLDVHVVTAPELQMQTAVMRLSGDADLRLRGTAARPVLLGRANILEGEAVFNGTKYHLERGDVTFTNPVATTPVVDLQATTHVRDYDITLDLDGSSGALNLTYRSEPPLPTAEIIALLAFGQTSEDSTQQSASQSAFSQQTSNAILAAALNETVNNRVHRLFGVSHIRVDPNGLETATSPVTNGPAVTIEEQVKDNLTITYTTDISQTSQQIIQGVYNVSRNVSIVGIRDQNGVLSFDIRIRRRKN
jgi:translocation and assembly module TamB